MGHETGLENCYVIKDHKKLRCGYTTGSCAAAAAKAAVWMLLNGKLLEEAALMTPKGILLHLLIEDGKIQTDAGGVPTEASCAVRKDGGDDPDATDKALVYAAVRKTQQEGVTVDGGKGVGRVTRPGLNQPVGSAAINEVPRSMIRSAVEEVCKECGYKGGIYVEISVPEGEEIARKTFNPRLGIEGGISILGTSGIVMPMSEEALIASIRTEMSMLTAAGAKYLVITPGNYGETFSRQMQDLDLTCEMKCSNYVGETVDMAVELGVRGILFIAHIGKFIKVSGGIMNTHSRNADARAELMAAAALRSGADRETAVQILASNTTEEALDVLAECGGELFRKTMEEICRRVKFYLDARCRGSMELGVILFSSVRGKLGETENVPELINHINTQTERIKR